MSRRAVSIRPAHSSARCGKPIHTASCGAHSAGIVNAPMAFPINTSLWRSQTYPGLLFLLRHAELVSASMACAFAQRCALFEGRSWTLKQVQGDEKGGCQIGRAS